MNTANNPMTTMDASLDELRAFVEDEADAGVFRGESDIHGAGHGGADADGRTVDGGEIALAGMLARVFDC